jgi:hypothetical protein
MPGDHMLMLVRDRKPDEGRAPGTPAGSAEVDQ